VKIACWIGSIHFLFIRMLSKRMISSLRFYMLSKNLTQLNWPSNYVLLTSSHMYWNTVHVINWPTYAVSWDRMLRIRFRLVPLIWHRVRSNIRNTWLNLIRYFIVHCAI